MYRQTEIPGAKESVIIQATLYEMMSHIMNRRNRKAALLLCEDFPELSLETVDFARVLSKKDLALYTIVLALSELNRLEIKDKVLKNPMIAQIIEYYPDASNIFEDYLNGKFESFQLQMNEIERHMQFDLNFGRHTGKQIFRDIRMKALR
jgi:polyhydroxyalkanoate synthesis regulator protein